MAEEFSTADCLAWKEFMETNATSLPLGGLENNEKDDDVNNASHMVNLPLLSDFGTNQDDVKVEEQPKLKLILRSLPFSEFILFWICVF